MTITVEGMKTTIIKLINGLLRPTSGKIYIDGVDLQTIDPSYERTVVSYLPQNTRLFNRPIIENMLYGTSKSKEQALVAMDRLGISDLFKKIDLSRPAGKNGDQLSGGQRQSVHLVRISLLNPKIIILDEPTTGIDQRHIGTIQNAIQQMSETINVILITHDPSFTVGTTLQLD